MKSCLWLERPSQWRWWGVLAVLALATLPVLPLLGESNPSQGTVWGQGVFLRSLLNSLGVGCAVAVGSLFLGLPLGVFFALYGFPGRQLCLTLLTLPLLVPSFLWAIGWSSVLARGGPAATALFAGHVGCVVVFLQGSMPLVLFTAYAATRTLSRSQIEAARLAGGETTVVRASCRHAALPAALAACVAGILTLSDPGPGQILGLPTAAAEILTSFAALYDFTLATRQCFVLAGLVLALTIPLAIVVTPRVVEGLLVRQTARASLTPPRGRSAALVGGMITVAVAVLAIPLAGLLVPLTRAVEFSRAGQEVARTWWNTLLYAGGAGLLATLVGFALAVLVGHSRGLRLACVGICFALFTVPPALGALGILRISAAAPAWSDSLLRGRLMVSLFLGLRFLPVATVLGLRAWATLPASWTQAAALHGVSTGRYCGKVVIPFLLPHAGVSVTLVTLLAAADVGTVLLLHPPGESSLPLAIFTVMANASETLVASLCACYLGGAALLLTLFLVLARRTTP